MAVGKLANGFDPDSATKGELDARAATRASRGARDRLEQRPDTPRPGYRIPILAADSERKLRRLVGGQRLAGGDFQAA